MTLVKKIDSGVLNLTINETNGGYKNIDEIVGFASRKNAKRGFLFVSKILGKHIPVKPSKMRNSYNQISKMIGPSEIKTLVVGMSETATGMGGGIADSLAKLNDESDVFFQHTTRHDLNQPEWFRLDEDHSHAVSHIVYEPKARLKRRIEQCSRLVLVDDEISTGKTLLRLAKGYINKLSKVKEIDIVALVSWLDDNKTYWFMKELEVFCSENNFELPKVNFHHLIRGSFEFEKNSNFNVDLPEGTDKDLATEKSLMDWGRCGIEMPIELEHDEIINFSKSDSISIVGTGEHLFYPFLVAEKLEMMGHNVIFQSTTRSPVFQDGTVIKSTDIISVQRTNQEPVKHYIYNLDKKNFHVEVISECEEAAKWHAPLMQNNTKKKKAA